MFVASPNGAVIYAVGSFHIATKTTQIAFAKCSSNLARTCSGFWKRYNQYCIATHLITSHFVLRCTFAMQCFSFCDRLAQYKVKP